MAGKSIAVNRRARHDYDIRESYHAGLVLTGCEIKSIRTGRVSLREAHARPREGEMWLHNMHISPYEQGNRANLDPLRPRKLLLHRSEIRRLAGKVQEKGLALIPLRLYLQRGYAKVEIALAKGRRQYDKRRAIAEREIQRDKERALRAGQRPIPRGSPAGDRRGTVQAQARTPRQAPFEAPRPRQRGDAGAHDA